MQKYITTILFAATLFMPVAATAKTPTCLRSPALDNQLDSLWREWRPLFAERLKSGIDIIKRKVIKDDAYPFKKISSNEKDVDFPFVIYATQIGLEPFVFASFRCGRLDWLEDIAGIYMLALSKLDQNRQIWVNPKTNDEVILNSTQFVMGAATVLHLASRLPNYSESAIMRRFEIELLPVLKRHLNRWITTRAMWIWKQCGVPRQAKSNLKAYTLAEYVRLKIKRKLTVAPKAPSYCNAVLEMEMHTAASVGHLLGAQNAGAIQLKPEQTREYSNYLSTTCELFESRWESRKYPKRRNDLERGPYMLFDADSFREHPELDTEEWKKATWAVATWDISHSRRLISWIEGLYRNGTKICDRKKGRKMLQELANTVAGPTLVGQIGDPCFANFLNGLNFTYRKYGASRLSLVYVTGRYASLANFNPVLLKINTSLLRKIASRQNLKCFSFDTRTNFGRFMRFNFYSSLAGKIDINERQ